ncbi:MAG: malonyl-CoA decarboxylase [Hyphomicrobiales bacterium]|nr:malonyl-CoA decarboxylase [Hyphomicrobiales bacterium]
MANQPATGHVLTRTLNTLRTAWRGIGGAAYDADTAAARPDLPEEDAERLRQQMTACLETKGGEVAARARAAALGSAYLALSAKGRRRFLRVLADNFDVDRAAVDAAMAAVRDAGGLEDRRKAERALRTTLKAPRVRLLTHFNALPQGVKFLVDMRADLLRFARQDPGLRELEDDLRGLLATWFDVDFLDLRRITWDSSPASLLEKLIAYEAVHPIESWDDLKNRLDADRRWFAYFHPAMPGEPIIFVEVALVEGMAGNVQALLDEAAPLNDPADATAAIFYSISNAQRGLAGIAFGNFLIKRVADALSHEFPGLGTFATLSPVPGFRAWLNGALDAEGPKLFKPAEWKRITEVLPAGSADGGRVKKLLDDRAWAGDPDRAAVLEGPLMRLCARYLAREKRPGGTTLDPVAHFHLKNGARMERLNWRGDLSPRGLEQSAGIMINYLYKLNEIDDNSDAYVTQGKVAVSSGLRALLKG